jgi:hypothetical protein
MVLLLEKHSFIYPIVRRVTCGLPATQPTGPASPLVRNHLIESANVQTSLFHH